MDDEIKNIVPPSYQMTEWEDHIVDPLDNEILQQGTPISARNLNKIEKGIFDAYQFLANMLALVETYEHLLTDLIHGLNGYPDVMVIEFEGGYGIGGYGTGGYGGSPVGKRLRYDMEYLDKNTVRLYLAKQYNPIDRVVRLSGNKYVLSFRDSKTSLLIIFADGVYNGSGGVTDTLERVTFSDTAYPNLKTAQQAICTALDAVSIEKI